MPSDKVTLKIPRPLYDHIKESIKGSGFGSVNEFVVYVLRDLTSALPAKSGPAGEAAERDPTRTDGSGLTREEIEIIKKRLHNLGYI